MAYHSKDNQFHHGHASICTVIEISQSCKTNKGPGLIKVGLNDTKNSKTILQQMSKHYPKYPQVVHNRAKDTDQDVSV